MQNIRHTLCKKYKIVGKNNRIIIKDGKKDVVLTKYKRISGLDIEINGSDNTITLTPETLFKSSKIIIEANNANLTFGTSPEINNLSVFVRLGNNQRLEWGNGSTITGGYIELCETNASVKIGHDCMIGWHVSMVATDFHAVLDKKTKKVLNGPGNIIIGDKCWLGHGVRLLKNAKIPNNTIVGAESVVTKKFTETYTVIGGNPAKIVKKNVYWDRKSPTELKEKL